MPSFEEQLDGNYSKIHKMLAVNNKNKDLRENLKDHLNEKEENKLSPNMWLTLNPVRIRSLLIMACVAIPPEPRTQVYLQG